MKALSKLAENYFLSLLLSVTLAIVILALRVERSILNIVLIFAASLLGVFVLELEYFIIAYWYHPESDFSANLRSLVSQKNWAGVATYIKAHKHAERETLLHNALFQVIVGLIALFLVTTRANIFGMVFALSAFVQTLYQMYNEFTARRNLVHWFSIVKEQPNKMAQIIYTIAILLFLLYILTQIPYTVNY